MPIPPQLMAALKRRAGGTDPLNGAPMAQPSIPGMLKPSAGHDGPKSASKAPGSPANGLLSPKKAPAGPPPGIGTPPPENAGGTPGAVPKGLTLGQGMVPIGRPGMTGGLAGDTTSGGGKVKGTANPITMGAGAGGRPGSGQSSRIGGLEKQRSGSNTGNAPGSDMGGFGAMARRMAGHNPPGGTLSSMLSGPGKAKLSPNNTKHAGSMLTPKKKGEQSGPGEMM